MGKTHDINEGNRREVTKVKDLILYAFVFILNLLVGVIALMGKGALDELKQINYTVGVINTTTQLNTQYIKNVDDKLKQHELADNTNLLEIKTRIREIENRGHYDKK